MQGEGAVVEGSEPAKGIGIVFTGLFSETVGVVKDIIGEVKAFMSKMENDGVAVDGVGKNSKENAVKKIES